MGENLDEKLRNALRPVDPEGDLAQDVLARIDAQERRTRKWPSFVRRERRWRIPVALAASVAIAIGIGLQWRQQQEGLLAREQLIEALRVTSSKLDLVHRVVQEHSQSDETRENGV
jgi:anti-sigma-K factor RskA